MSQEIIKILQYPPLSHRIVEDFSEESRGCCVTTHIVDVGGFKNLSTDESLVPTSPVQLTFHRLGSGVALSFVNLNGALLVVSLPVQGTDNDGEFIISTLRNDGLIVHSEENVQIPWEYCYALCRTMRVDEIEIVERMGVSFDNIMIESEKFE